jgi:uncharacterized phage-associated protein
MARVDDVAAFVLEQSGTMTTYKLHKLLYYAQGWSLAWDGKPLFDAKVKAWENGPVVSSLFNDHRGVKHVHAWPNGQSSQLSDEEKDAVRAVLEMYGAKSPDELVAMTHEEAPWKNAWTGDKTTAREITVDAMTDFFSKLAAERRQEAPSSEAVALGARLRKFIARGDS